MSNKSIPEAAHRKTTTLIVIVPAYLATVIEQVAVPGTVLAKGVKRATGVPVATMSWASFNNRQYEFRKGLGAKIRIGNPLGLSPFYILANIQIPHILDFSPQQFEMHPIAPP